MLFGRVLKGFWTVKGYLNELEFRGFFDSAFSALKKLIVCKMGSLICIQSGFVRMFTII